MSHKILLALPLLGLALSAETVPFEISAVRPGAALVTRGTDSVTVQWPDEANRVWKAVFSLDPAKPLITSIGTEGNAVIALGRPLYWVATGKRRGGWDAFFDFPVTHPDGTRQYTGNFKLKTGAARSVGDRIEVQFDGLNLGVFQGAISYTFYPGSRLVEQEAVVSTQEPDTAYYYDTGLRIATASNGPPGGIGESTVTWYDTQGQLRTTVSTGPERTPLAVRYRTLAMPSRQGSVAVFPPPHQYFFARDLTSNLGYVWHSSWHGAASLGIRQLPDDNTNNYPWMNAPPGTWQRMGVFFLLGYDAPRQLLEHVVKYTNRDRFPSLDGYRTLSSHWHFAYTVQALEKPSDWVPPFKPVLENMGVQAAIIDDFHGDGHAKDLTGLRLKELNSYFEKCKKLSDDGFTLIPAEEANVHLGGHWSLIFPKPVYWYMDRPKGPERTGDPQYGTVYHIGNAKEMWDMVKREGGYVYQTHPRTKGSTGFPDKIRDTDYFRDPWYFGAGFKAMPSDLSSPRLGERVLKLLDDMNNWGLHKRLIGEVDVFQIDATHELYAHMNVNYIRIKGAPSWASYVAAVAQGDYFVTTGEILLPKIAIRAMPQDEIEVHADVRWTYPLRMAEVVWGNGTEVRRQVISLEQTRQFGSQSFEWKAVAPGWRWARLAVWDVAGNGAFVNPVWK